MNTRFVFWLMAFTWNSNDVVHWGWRVVCLLRKRKEDNSEREKEWPNNSFTRRLSRALVVTQWTTYFSAEQRASRRLGDANRQENCCANLSFFECNRITARQSLPYMSVILSFSRWLDLREKEIWNFSCEHAATAARARTRQSNGKFRDTILFRCGLFSLSLPLHARSIQYNFNFQPRREFKNLENNSRRIIDTRWRGSRRMNMKKNNTFTSTAITVSLVARRSESYCATGPKKSEKRLMKNVKGEKFVNQFVSTRRAEGLEHFFFFSNFSNLSAK